MKIKFLATGNSPDYYGFQANDEIVTAYKDNKTEEFDLSSVETGGKFSGLNVDTLDLSGQQIIRNAYRDDDGELHVELCQQVGPGNWSEGSEYDATQYDPDSINVTFKSESQGKPWALTKQGKKYIGGSK